MKVTLDNNTYDDIYKFPYSLTTVPQGMGLGGKNIIVNPKGSEHYYFAVKKQTINGYVDDFGHSFPTIYTYNVKDLDEEVDEDKLRENYNLYFYDEKKEEKSTNWHDYFGGGKKQKSKKLKKRSTKSRKKKNIKKYR